VASASRRKEKYQPAHRPSQLPVEFGTLAASRLNR
jgi:hypothetical protein